MKGAEVFYRHKAAGMMQRARAIRTRIERMKVEKPEKERRIRLRLDGSAGVGKNLILAQRLGFLASAAFFIGAAFCGQVT